MKRKSLLLVLILCFVTACCALLFTACASGDGENEENKEPTEGLEYALNETQDAYAVVSIGEATDTNIVIPAEHLGLPVTAISDSAFRENTSITSVKLPNSVTDIVRFTFFRCTSLTSITISNSVTSIYSLAFGYCTSLESIVVDKDNTVYRSAGNCLIETESKTLILGCKNSVIPNDGSVTAIGDGAFHGCTSLTSITIPNSVTSIGNSAFYYCTSLTSITIPNSVTFIDVAAFDDCTSLTIYCEATEQPSGWHPYWNLDNLPVVWDCKKEH
ncbi:MAG: leucine-rich repeat domain-containing protein [Muribaculaceae bacterium]|nr:leucine-rich repeat domain-containing protein [Muribaculaceae bacterium]